MSNFKQALSGIKIVARVDRASWKPTYLARHELFGIRKLRNSRRIFAKLAKPIGYKLSKTKIN